MNTSLVRASVRARSNISAPSPRAAAAGVFWRTPHRTFQRAKGAAGTEFLTTQKEIQDALAQGLKEAKSGASSRVVYQGLHHVGLLVDDLERSLGFYEGVLGLEVNPARPHDKLPYRGAWLWLGSEMIHLMQLPDPDTRDPELRPQHGGRDRHFCIGVQTIEPLLARLEASGVPYTKSMSGRPALFFRDPDMNVLEIGEMGTWRE